MKTVRARRWCSFQAGRSLAERVREALEIRLQRVAVIDDALIPDDALVAVVRALELAGVTAITARCFLRSGLPRSCAQSRDLPTARSWLARDSMTMRFCGLAGVSE